MLPDNSASLYPVPGTFLYPDNLIPEKLYEDYELGGIAIQDSSEGLRYQLWTCKWISEERKVKLFAERTGAVVEIISDVEVRELSFSFDQNMRWVLALLNNLGQFLFYWYDTVTESYVITPISGVGAFKVAHDDKNPVAIRQGFSDVILTYTQLNNLYVRNQRDRYATPHLINNQVPANVYISNFGMTNRNRMQWRMRARLPKEKI